MVIRLAVRISCAFVITLQRHTLPMRGVDLQLQYLVPQHALELGVTSHIFAVSLCVCDQ
jgi:hypothetical protein